MDLDLFPFLLLLLLKGLLQFLGDGPWRARARTLRGRTPTRGLGRTSIRITVLSRGISAGLVLGLTRSRPISTCPGLTLVLQPI